MHGVGMLVFNRVIESIGFQGYIYPVLEQVKSNHVNDVLLKASPDPDFPTVKFPNPEEKSTPLLTTALILRYIGITPSPLLCKLI